VDSEVNWSFSIPGLTGYSLMSHMTFLAADSDSDETSFPPAEVVSSGNATLSESGELSFEMAFEPKPDPKPRTLRAYLTATDVDGRPVTRTVSIPAHPADLFAAMKARDYLARAGEPLTIDLAAADLGGSFHQAEVSISLYRRSWNTVRRRDYSSNYAYDSKAYDELVETKTVSIGPEIGHFELIPPKAGYYWARAELTDSKGRPNESPVSFSATGPGAVGWRYDSEETVTLVPDKPEYAPGDVARILVQSPFQEGQALVTVERSFIKEERVFDLTDQSPIVEIPITEADGPNLYVSVTLSRGRVSDKLDQNGVDLGKPAVRQGYLSLMIPANSDVLKVEVAPDKEKYSPGQEVVLDLSVASQDGAPFSDAEVALAVVDASLVQVAGDQQYFPDRLFSALRPLTVITASPINYLISRRELREIGGQGVDGGGGSSDAPPMQSDNASADIRAKFLDLAYYNPAVALGPDGRARASFNLPDNLTTFLVYAVATGHGRVSGTGQAKVLSTMDVLLRSSLPSFATVGDEFSAAVMVTNRLDTPGKARVYAEADGLALLGPELSQEVEIPAGQSVEVLFPAKAEAPGKAMVRFRLEMGDLSDEAHFSVNINPANQPTVQASYRPVPAGETKIDLSLVEGFDPTQGGLSVTLSPTLASVMAEPLQWLASYPYECLEQTTSKAFGALFRLRLADKLPTDENTIEAAKKRVLDHLERLSSVQYYRGDFPLWPGGDGPYPYPHMSAYALEFILEAQSIGIVVPDDDMVQKATEFLLAFVGDPASASPPYFNAKAVNTASLYAIMALSRAGAPVEGPIETHFRNSAGYDLIDLLYLARAVGYQPKSSSRTEMLLDLLPKIISRLETTSGGAAISVPKAAKYLWFDTDKLTALAALTLSETAPHNVFLTNIIRTLIDRTRSGHLSSTQSNVLALWAIANHLDQVEAEEPALKVRALLGDATLFETSFNSFLQPEATASVALADIPSGSSLAFSAEGSGQLWSTVKLSQAKAEADLSAELGGGLVVSRSYTVIRPAPEVSSATQFSRGQVVRVDLVLMTPDDRHDLFLEDRVPAGFEVVNFNLRSEDLTLLPALSGGEGSSSDGWSWLSHQQIWADHLTVFADYLPAGVYTYSYLVRPATPGVYHVTGPVASGMYDPETFGRGAGHVIEVAK
jgi:uncharacterized protein YfaS (alpha-2-macroglobulin family)